MENTVVKTNLMSDKSYTPYCGNDNCPTMPRTIFNGEQFVCPVCSWKSQFTKSFIKRYCLKHFTK